MNTEFLAGVLVAWLVGEMDFALGPTLAARRQVTEAMGGFDELGHCLAEDFEIGNRAPRLGYRVVLSSCVIEHRIGSQTLKENLQHRLRWARSTRRSRPMGYWGQIFTNLLPLALLLWLAVPRLWPLVGVTVFFRALAAWSTAKLVLHDPLTSRRWWLIPVQDADEPLGLDLGIFREHDRWARSPIQSLTRRPFSTCGKCTRGAGNRAHAPGNNGTLSSARHQASQERKKRARRLRFRVLWLCRLSPSPRDMF